MDKHMRLRENKHAVDRVQPIVDAHVKQVQEFGRIVKLPIALSEKVCAHSVENLNQILADTMALRDLYKKHHWQVSGPNFYQLHLLFDKHYEEQAELIDKIAERIQTLGGVCIAMAQDVVELTLVPRPPKGREDFKVQIERLLQAHEIILRGARSMAEQSEDEKDEGSTDLLVSEVIPHNELQVWFLSQHLFGSKS